jgi:superfamily II DNA or RNA helicase
MIIKRGINLPLIRMLINAAGGDSETNVLQILGRALRKHATKDSVKVVDFYDEGAYLMRHSKHRVKFYKDQKFKVKELYKKDY